MHDPKNESWREISESLEKAKHSERAYIVRRWIEEHPRDRFALEYAPFGNINLRGTYLSLAILPKGHFENADFQGANLQNADLQGGNFEDANLKYTDLFGANLQGAKLIRRNIGVNLQEANLEIANLQDAELMGADLQGANLFDANLRGADLREAKIQGAELQGADFRGANLQRAKLEHVDLSHADNLSNVFISGAWLDRSRMRHEQFGDAIGEELQGYYAGAKRGYLALKQNFDDLGDYEGSSWAYRKERRMEKLEAWHNVGIELWGYRTHDGDGNIQPHQVQWRAAATSCFKYFSDTFVELLCDYGESVWKVIFWMSALLFVIGPVLFSSLGGIIWSKELTREYYALSPLPQFWLWYRTYLLYTLDTLTTASFSGLQPINDAVKLASGFFAIAGIVLAGLLGFVAGNRIRRS